MKRQALQIGSITLLSRIFGLLRDIVIAKQFGSGLVTDAFFVAFKIPNLLRRLLGEGSLTVAFIPVFTESIHKEGKEKALRLANTFLTLLSLILCFVSILGIVLSPLIVKIQAYGFDSSSYKLAVLLTRITFPYVFFICLVAFFMGVLNSFKHFFAPSFAPVLLNLSIISSAFLISPHLRTPVVGLAIGVIVGGFLQLLFQIPWAIKYGLSLKPSFSLINHPSIKKIFLLMIPSIFGSAVYQLNQFISTFLASFLQRGSISWLYYADRLVQFPLGIFAISISTAALPELSDHVSRSKKERFERTLFEALSLTFFISIPASAGLIVLGKPIIMILFERGRFLFSDTENTYSALFFYCLGLWAFSGIRVLVSAFYAMQDTKTPVKVATLSLFLNFILGLILMHPLKHNGLALSLSSSSSFQFLLLLLFLKKKADLKIKKLALNSAKFLFCSVIMGIAVHLVHKNYLPISSEMGILTKMIRLCYLITTGVFIYLFFSKLIKVKEVDIILKKGGYHGN